MLGERVAGHIPKAGQTAIPAMPSGSTITRNCRAERWADCTKGARRSLLELGNLPTSRCIRCASDGFDELPVAPASYVLTPEFWAMRDKEMPRRAIAPPRGYCSLRPADGSGASSSTFGRPRRRLEMPTGL